MGQLYGQIVQIRSRLFDPWTTSWADSLMKEAAARFPLTAPPAAPTLADQVREAAILDRYRRMKAAVKRDLDDYENGVGCGDLGRGSAGAFVAADTLQVGPEFFRATAANQISLLLEQLASRRARNRARVYSCLCVARGMDSRTKSMSGMLPLSIRPSPSFVSEAIVGLPALVETAGWQ